MYKKIEMEFYGRPLSIETGRMAKQADGAAVVSYGETVVLVTVVASSSPREGTDFFPLTVDYQERTYAAGKIPGGFFKREGRPPEREILTSRLVDRALRPLFPDGFFCETQVVASVLSVDRENDADTIAMIGASAALQVSDIPFRGPIAGVRIGRLQHAVHVPGARRCRGRIRAGRRAGAAAEHGGNARHQRFLDLLRADHVDMRIDPTRGRDRTLAGDDLGAGADGNRHARLDVGIAGLADRADPPVLDADIGFDDAPVIDDQCIGDHRVGHFRGAQLALSHAVANHLAAAELHLFAVDGEVLLDLDPQLGVREPHAIADGGPEHLGVGRARYLRRRHSLPMIWPKNPYTVRAPASSTSVTVRSCPGSKRTAVPATMFSRNPRACSRSNRSASLVS